MTSFNSLGSNYSVSFIFKSLFTANNSKYHNGLINFLEKKYQGKAMLYYKGREALEVSLRILGLKSESQVLICGFTCYAVYRAIKNAGLTPAYADIDESLNFLPSTLEKLVKKNPMIKVVIVQNTLGAPCDMKNIGAVCKKNNLVLIEDLAHCIGAKYNDLQEAGSVGDLVVFSFSQDKMIDGVTGGALVVRNKKYLSKIINSNCSVSVLQQVKDRSYPMLTFLIRKSYQSGIGKGLHLLFKKSSLLIQPMAKSTKGNYRNLPAWNCRLIIDGFDALYSNLSHRREIASVYLKFIDRKVVSPLQTDILSQSSNLRFVVVAEDRKGLIRYLKKFDIHIADTWYDAPIAPKKYLSDTSYAKGDCPNSEKFSEIIINLPTHRGISQFHATRIASKINSWQELQLKK